MQGENEQQVGKNHLVLISMPLVSTASAWAFSWCRSEVTHGEHLTPYLPVVTRVRARAGLGAGKASSVWGLVCSRLRQALKESSEGGVLGVTVLEFIFGGRD